MNDLNAALLTQIFEPLLDPMRLPQRQLRSPRTDHQHGLISKPEYPAHDGDEMVSIRMRSLLAQLGNRSVSDLVDNPARKLFDGVLLLARHGAELVPEPRQFREAKLF